MPTVLDTVGFDDKLPCTTAVLTGEGRIDGQSLRGKVVVGIAHWALKAGVPVNRSGWRRWRPVQRVPISQ
ncbi:MAG: glycerate kinase [Oscillospiraceae bacterium]